MIHPVRDIRQGRRHKRFWADMREKERAKHEELVADDKCAKRPAGLAGPSCEFDSGHDGRCSWGAFFEPNGDFHAVDPDGPYPMLKAIFPKRYYCGWCGEIGYEGPFGPGRDDVCSQCGKNLNVRCPECNWYGHAGPKDALRSHRESCPNRPVWRTMKNLLSMYYKHACGIGCADYMRTQELAFLRKQLRRR